MPDTIEQPVETPPVEEPVEAEPEAPVEEEVDEKYSAQVTRRMHQDAVMLLEQYDAMKGPLEHDPTLEIITRKLENLVEEIEELEGHFTEHHPDAKALDGAGDDEMPVDETDDAVQDSSDEDLPEPEPEEAVEGMKKENKSLKGKKKALCPECGKENCKCGKAMKKKAMTEDEADAIKDKIDEEAADTEKKAFPDDNGEENEQEFDEGGEGGGALSKALEPHERSSVGQAAGFLGELGEEQNFGDEHRMKAYHYGETLKGIGWIEDMAHDNEPKEVEPGTTGEKIGPLVAAGLGYAAGRILGDKEGVEEEDEQKKKTIGNVGRKIAPLVAGAIGAVAGGLMGGGGDKAMHPHRKA
mgnify:FL=1